VSTINVGSWFTVKGKGYVVIGLTKHEVIPWSLGHYEPKVGDEVCVVFDDHGRIEKVTPLPTAKALTSRPTARNV
jgi:hypothetical protein